MKINIFRDIIPFIICIASIILIFFKKNKYKDDSLSIKFLTILKREYPIIVTIIILYFIFNYAYLISNPINLNINFIYNLFWNQWNGCIIGIMNILRKIFITILELDILKIIIIGYFTTKVLLNEDVFERLKYFISQIKEINIKNISIKTQEARKEKDYTKKEIENIKEKEAEGEIDPCVAKTKIENIQIKSEIIAILMDNNEIVNYLDSFINKNSSKITIPKNLIPSKISLGALEKLFICELSVNSIKILGIKSDIFKIVKSTYEELLEKGIIYCKDYINE